MNQRNTGIDVTRCVANYMIIVLHASAVNQYCNQTTTEASFWNFIYEYVCPAALPVLFMISGYLLFKNFTLGDYPRKLKNRVGRLVVPYLAWNIFFVTFFIVGSLAVPRLAERVATFDLFSIQGAVSKVVSLMVHPIDGPLWFIRTLFIYSLISPIMAVFLKNKYLSYTFLAIIICVGLWLANKDLTRYLTLTYPVYSLIMFFIGGMLSKTIYTPISLFEGKKMLVFSLLCLVAITIKKQWLAIR